MEASSHFRGAEKKIEEEPDQRPDLSLVTELGIDGPAAGTSLGNIVLGNVIGLRTDLEESDEANLPPSIPRLRWTMSDDVMLKARTGRTRQIWG